MIKNHYLSDKVFEVIGLYLINLNYIEKRKKIYGYLNAIIKKMLTMKKSLN